MRCESIGVRDSVGLFFEQCMFSQFMSLFFFYCVRVSVNISFGAAFIRLSGLIVCLWFVRVNWSCLDMRKPAEWKSAFNWMYEQWTCSFCNRCDHTKLFRVTPYPQPLYNVASKSATAFFSFEHILYEFHPWLKTYGRTECSSIETTIWKMFKHKNSTSQSPAKQCSMRARIKKKEEKAVRFYMNRGLSVLFFFR